MGAATAGAEAESCAKREHAANAEAARAVNSFMLVESNINEEKVKEKTKNEKANNVRDFILRLANQLILGKCV